MKEALDKYFQDIVKDLGGQNPKVPVSAFRIETSQIEGSLYAPDWFQYMIYGRGPGKQPPPDRMLAWVTRNPSMLADARSKWKHITDHGLAYLIGRKIGREGTRIWKGEAKGVDLLGAMERALPDLKISLEEAESLKIQIGLSKAIKA